MSETNHERCPLSERGDGAMLMPIPMTCLRQCEELWDQAVKQRNVVGEYYLYDQMLDEDDECVTHGFETEFSDDAISKTEGAKRNYSIVHECTSCMSGYGTQSYRFICPFDQIESE